MQKAECRMENAERRARCQMSDVRVLMSDGAARTERVQNSEGRMGNTEGRARCQVSDVRVLMSDVMRPNGVDVKSVSAGQGESWRRVGAGGRRKFVTKPRRAGSNVPATNQRSVLWIVTA